MIRKKKSLFLIIAFACVSIALLSILIYSIFALFVFGKGVDAVTKANLINYLQNYANIDQHINGQEKNKIENLIIITNNYEDIPNTLRQKLPKTINNDILYTFHIEKGDGNNNSLYCLIAMETGGKRYFAYQNIPKYYAETFIKPAGLQALQMLFIVGLGSLIALTIFTLLLLRRISTPIYNLSIWVNELSPQNINDPIPNFVYPELTQIAQFIQQNLSRIYTDIKEEELFWRYFSHEMRTPITSISIGIELLQKKVQLSLEDKIKYNSILLRLKKSAYSISYLIETILWIGNSQKKLVKSEVYLDKQLKEVVDDLQSIYNLENIPINIVTSSHKMKLPQTAARIVLENIIRNAFQHSMGEEIVIVQHKNKVKVLNKIIPANGLLENTGFGLGLKLIERLSFRLGWRIKVLKNGEYNIVEVDFE